MTRGVPGHRMVRHGRGDWRCACGERLGESRQTAARAMRWHAQSLKLRAEAERHRYLSPACLHATGAWNENLHGWCQRDAGAECRFCGAPCRCLCHRATSP